ncbi:fibrinogen-like YCDxxxxGGGW domain-containing protein [Planomonospora parontospora]|uniref:fibrinogen-like YCDxxxxGGGW domain-containing protein n=1 Tax=Planomonospora parontospora TaxID=58119 RepID=UPI00166F8BF7|nr:fibrinogen-like YCDxxxxGGGW domain-containing protein [Planomonospora parontospora]GGL56987.1 hypothetical protein GCM10014719_67990 [Planomonospora parontospora subsp. antibiotica]GII15146.1 hypothetical protein Ppa05_18720 [Planomonospora parontospora subsp. antibiotica]
MALLVGATGLAVPGTAYAAPPPADGTAADRAAPSCWAIKQSHPSSADGVYWLQTPALVAPQQFYCDMTTDGGGWVLIGRGRQGWEFDHNGQRSPGDVRNTPAGTGAFAPAALSGDTVDGLLDGGRVDALPDGVRLRRAANAAGTAWQEVRWKFAARKKWSWTFDGSHRLTSTAFDGATVNGGTTRDVNANNGTRRVFTYEWADHGYQKGFSYGSAVGGGSNSGTAHLWQNGAEGHPIPFTQVFIRPKLTAVEYPAVPDEGTAASTVAPLVSNQTAPTPWGVTGVTGGGSGEQNIEVQSLAVLGDTLFVGGKFEYVQKGANPAPTEKIRQPYLAAFDVNTGEWRPDFLPVLNGQVWDIQAADDKIIIGGEFTSVNGAADTGGLAALDPVTGAAVPGWRAPIAHTSQTPLVRTLDREGDWIYVGGQFNRISGGVPVGSQITLSRAARVRVSDGRPDGTWKPNFNGVPMELDATAERVYFGGHFTTVNGDPARKVAVITATSPPTQVAGLNDQNWVPSSSTVQKQYRQVIREFGDHVWIGGSEHDFQMYTKSGFDRVRGSISVQGGDFQTAVELNGVVYGACHCDDFIYQDATTWPDPGTNWTEVNKITFIGAWDAGTGEYLPDFNPPIRSRAGAGPWEMIADDNGCIWFGGDMNRGSWTNAGYQWLGGFGRFCSGDAQAPAAPANLTLAGTTGGNQLVWSAATDNAGAPRYEVLRDDHVIATVNGTSYIDATAYGTHRYFVRAIDASGNRSASTPVLRAERTETLIATGATWRWVYDGVDQGTAWRAPGFDDSSWQSGPAQLGFGDSDEATVIPGGTAPRPMTAYFRSTVEVADPAAYQELVIDLLRDDGAVVYVNGTEVARDNLPEGDVSYGTAALVGLQTNAEERTPVRFTVPAAALVAGTNTIAVEMHQANAWSSDLSFALSMSATVN